MYSKYFKRKRIKNAITFIYVIYHPKLINGVKSIFLSSIFLIHVYIADIFSPSVT